MRCKVEGCEGNVEANGPIWYALGDDGSWFVYGVGVDEARVECDAEGHDNSTRELLDRLAAFAAEVEKALVDGWHPT